MELGKKDNFVTATRPGDITENEYGDLTSSTTTDVATFWASVKEIEPLEKDLTFDYGKPRLTRTLRLNVDSRDAATVQISDHLQIDSSSTIYQVSEIFESDWKYGITLIAQIKN